jgi:hypothetical protein
MKGYELVLGPQDGGKVAQISARMPGVIFVGPRPLGDGYAAWSSERSNRFPHAYLMQSDGRFWFEYKLAGLHDCLESA